MRFSGGSCIQKGLLLFTGGKVIFQCEMVVQDEDVAIPLMDLQESEPKGQ